MRKYIRVLFGLHRFFIQNAITYALRSIITSVSNNSTSQAHLQPTNPSDAGTGGGQGGHCLPPPIFGRSVNPITTGEGRLFPPITTGTPNVFHLPASLSVNKEDGLGYVSSVSASKFR